MSHALENRKKKDKKITHEGMASEVAMEPSGTAAAAAAAETETVPAAVTKEPHRSERKWTFWFDNQSKPKQGATWGTSLRKVYTFNTVEDFWWYLSNLPQFPDLFMFLCLLL